MIETTWQEVSLKAKNENQMLWNGNSLRLNDLQINGDELTLITSVIDFRERLGISRNFNKIEYLGRQYFGMGMAVGGMIETIDGNYIFINRSPKSVNLNRTDFVGGVMDRIEATSGEDLVAHAYQEIKEETNLDEEDIIKAQVLGIIMSITSSVIILINVKVKLSRDEVLNKFDIMHDEEVGSLKIIPSTEVVEFLISLGGYKPSVVQLMGL